MEYSVALGFKCAFVVENVLNQMTCENGDPVSTFDSIYSQGLHKRLVCCKKTSSKTNK